jgi:lipopolysaccharide heptosyltransferase I
VTPPEPRSGDGGSGSEASSRLKVFILKPSSLGDVIQALPVLRMIRKHRPEAEVYWWLDGRLLPLLEGDPDLAGVIPFERQRWSSPLHWDEAVRSIRAIRAHRFDWVIDLQSLARSAACAWLAGGEFTVGLEDAREGAHALYDVAVPRTSYDTHAVDWYLKTLAPLGVPIDWNIEWLPVQPRVAQAVQDKWHPDDGRWIAILPGARWATKRWPTEYFVAVVRDLAAHFADARFAVLGGMDDQEAGRAIAAAAPGRSLDLTGRTSLPEMVEWIRRCDLVVTNDTGPMHVAAAVGRRVLGIFGPTEPSRTGPYRQVGSVLQLQLPCVPCLSTRCRLEKTPLECLRGIGPEIVIERATAMLK